MGAIQGVLTLTSYAGTEPLRRRPEGANPRGPQRRTVEAGGLPNRAVV